MRARLGNSSGFSNVLASVLLVSVTFAAAFMGFSGFIPLLSSQNVSAKLQIVSATAVSSGTSTIVLADITNYGATPLSVSRVEAAGETTLSHDCPNPLKPGTSCKAWGSVAFRQPGQVVSLRAVASYGDSPVVSQLEVIVT